MISGCCWIILFLGSLSVTHGAVKDLGVECVPNTDTCAHATLELTCSVKTCLAKVGQACTSSATCVTGAKCDSSACACGSQYTHDASAGTCTIATAGKPGGACDGGNCDSGAECVNNMCTCKAGYTLDPDTAACTTSANALGGECTADSTDEGSCTSTDAVCPGTSGTAVCQCPAGKTPTDCTAAIAANTLGGACTSGSCTVTNAECPSDTFCACASGYISLDGSTCVTVAGTLGGGCTATTAYTQGVCTSASHVCSGTTAGTCLLKVDQSCAGNIDKCVTGATCDTNNNNVCKCITATHTEDTATKTCLINLDGACANGPSCISAAVCDSTANKCLLKVDQDCSSNTGKCVTGASCDNNVCKCNTATHTEDTATKTCMAKGSKNRGAVGMAASLITVMLMAVITSLF